MFQELSNEEMMRVDGGVLPVLAYFAAGVTLGKMAGDIWWYYHR